MSNVGIKVNHRGDDGTTSLAGGTRVAKNSPYIEALGIVDELNSAVGMVIASDCGSDLRGVLCEIQEDLVALSLELSAPCSVFLTDAALQTMDKELARWAAELPEPGGIPLPRGPMAAALCFKARATCRTLERCLVGLADGDPDAAANSVRLPFVNRLADLLHVLARTVNRRANAEVFARSGAAAAPGQT
ncbi:MAG: cob(I)yrinic acid a,c-diamide adenosyltransferase [Betaproteobacteria bacterium]|jgi:cob(I)alamin adenosyltransferase|nr:cob(I)yrinic acid a,c-diamide adenosyltransferase [Betaproteobacteria bacterium]